MNVYKVDEQAMHDFLRFLIKFAKDSNSLSAEQHIIPKNYFYKNYV